MQKINLLYSDDEKKRLDVFIANNTDLSRSRVQSLINDEKVFINGQVSSKNAKVSLNDVIEVIIPQPKEYTATAENIPLEIVFEDDDLLVVNKPKGMVVHPAAGNYNGTLVNALLWHCGDSLSGINGVMRPGILHRIDKNTSGLLIVAKNDFSHERLALQIKEHSFTREYEAVVYGRFKEKQGTINAPIGRHPLKRKQMAVTDKNSREAITHYSVIKEYDEFSHIRLKLETGRTHQIRVHMAYLGHSVAGDDVYGPKKVIKSLCGQCLHAKKIGFIHPRTNEYLEFESDLPNYFQTFLKRSEG